jgi:hypothetical protein
MSFSLFRKFNLKILAIGHIVFNSLDYGFDYVLYPYVIYKFGYQAGFVIMGLLSAALCLGISWIYDLLKKDWLGIEAVKEIVEEFFAELKQEAEISWRRRGKKILSWVFHRNKIGQFLFLSLHFDPLITTIYMREGAHQYNGFKARDWKIFWGSVIVSNLWWSSFSVVVLTAVEQAFIKIF